MNFQTVSVAEKVDSPGTLTKNANGTYTVGPTELAGYYPGTTTPRPLLAGALRLRQRAAAADGRHDPPRRPASSTAIIVTAKHGQSPQDPLLLKRIDDGPIISAINEAWTAQTGDQNNADRRRHRRRPVAELPVGQDAGRGRLRQELPVEPQRDGGALQQRRREPRHRAGRALRPGADLRRPGGRRLLRRAVLGPAPPGRVRPRPGRRRLHRRHARSPSTAATTQATATCRSSSTRPGRCTTAPRTNG